MRSKLNGFGLGIAALAATCARDDVLEKQGDYKVLYANCPTKTVGAIIDQLSQIETCSTSSDGASSHFSCRQRRCKTATEDRHRGMTGLGHGTSLDGNAAYGQEPIPGRLTPSRCPRRRA